MDILGGAVEQIEVVRDRLGSAVDVAGMKPQPENDDVLGKMRRLDGDDVVDIMERIADARHALDSVEAVAAGVIAERSTREAGQDGLAQKRGHRNAAALVQAVTGSGKAAANQRIRVGRAVLEGAPASDERPDPWHAPIAAALLAGEISTEQSDAIRMGLDAPPVGMEDSWRGAARDLVREAADRTLEELRAQARLLRDLMDPDGAERRFLARYDARSFRSWTTAEGIHRASIVFDDEGFAAVSTIEAAALRPRRGGPRFVDSDEVQAAKKLVDDPRTNDQLLYDLMIDLLNAGAVADAATVHGTRKAGVRVVTVVGDTAPGAAGDTAPREISPISKATADVGTGSREVASVSKGSAGSGTGTREIPLVSPGAAGGGSGSREIASVSTGTVDGGSREIASISTDGTGSESGKDERTGLSTPADRQRDSEGPPPGERRYGVGGMQVRGGYTEDGMRPLPRAAIDQRICDTGTLRVTVDASGDPLNVGRESRLFTAAQRVALVARDGGCRWPGCVRDASYCEAHHIDPYSEGGRTDIDRGILLCRFHHMHLHHQKWRIEREGKGDFILRGPNRETREMPRRVGLRHLFDNYTPPPRRFRKQE